MEFCDQIVEQKAEIESLSASNHDLKFELQSTREDLDAAEVDLK